MARHHDNNVDAAGCIILACRVQRVSDGVCRLYLVQCGVGSSSIAAPTTNNKCNNGDAQHEHEHEIHNYEGIMPNTTNEKKLGVMSCQWLSKISTEDAARIPCCGLVATENVVMSGGGGGYMAYSFWQPQAEGKVAVCAVHFPSSLEQGRGQALYDFSLPDNVVSAVSGFGQTSMSEGGLLMSDTGCVIGVSVRPKVRTWDDELLCPIHSLQINMKCIFRICVYVESSIFVFALASFFRSLAF